MLFRSAARCVSSILLTLMSPIYSDWGEFAKTVLEILMTIIFLNIIPITAGLFILKFDIRTRKREIYAKPRYFGRSFGIFPAGYGLAIACSLITTLIGMLIPEGNSVSDSFTTAQNALSANDPASAEIIDRIVAVIAADEIDELCRVGV